MSPAAPTSLEQNRVYYDDFAAWYERERGRGYHRMLDDIEVDIVTPYARGKRVLELGCGTGLILGRIAAVAGHAEGIDLSEGMIDKARERGLDVRVGSVTDLPYEDATFDVVYSFKVLAHVPDIAKAVAEAARVTRPGGTMILEFYNPYSLRYLAKKIAGPQPISEGRTEADVFTRWDAPSAIPKLLPSGVSVVRYHGVRVLTPAAFVHRVPVVRDLLARAEHAVADSPLRWFGGFFVAVLRRDA
jgi:ubiquinone/menaquinone biosynthesis C-methylase UbiE